MKVVNEDCLNHFRGPGVCEVCRKRVRMREPHHVHSRGAGRIDHPWNLVALDRECHTRLHYTGKPTRRELLEVVAAREQTTPEAIEELIYSLRRKPKP